MSELKFVCRSFQVCDALNFKEDSSKCAVLTWWIIYDVVFRHTAAPVYDWT